MSRRKQFLVEIEIPDDTGDLCWDQDETGLQAFHDCIAAGIRDSSLHWLCASVNERKEYRDFIERQNKVRDSFKVISTVQPE